MQTSKSITREINIKGESVHRSQMVRYLGVWLESDLTFKTHVKKCTTAMLNLQRIKNIKIPYHRLLCQVSGKPLHVTLGLL